MVKSSAPSKTFNYKNIAECNWFGLTKGFEQ